MRIERDATVAVATVLGVLLLLPHTIVAEPLTLEQAVQRSIERHPGLAAASDSADAANEVVGQAQSAYWPRISLTSSYRYSGPIAEMVIDTGMMVPGQSESLVFANELGTAHNAMVGLQAGWRLYDFGARDSLVNAAEASVRAAESDRDTIAADIAFAVRTSYLAARFYDEVVEITSRSVEIARQEQNDRETRLRIGLGNDVETAAAAARTAALEARLVEVQSNRELALITLRQLIGLDIGADLELVDGIGALDSLTAAVAPANHPGSRGLTELRQALESQAEATSRSFFPTLDLAASTAYQFPETFVNTEEAGIVYSIGLMLTWDLFDGFQRHHQEAELLSRAGATGNMQNAFIEEVERQQTDALLRLRAAEAQLEATERQLEAAEAYRRVVLSASEVGAGSAIDELEAEGAVDLALLGEAQARFAQAMASADLMRASGLSTVTRSNDSSQQPND